MYKQDYISLITRALSDELTSLEAKKLESLRNTDSQNKALYDDMSELWELTGNYTPNVSFDSSSAFDKFAANYKIPTDSNTKSSRFGFDYKLILSTAVIALLLVSSSLYFYNNTLSKNILHNKTNQIETVAHGDDNIILAPGSSITFSKEGKLVDVTGNAYFNDNENIVISLGSDQLISNGAVFNVSKAKDSGNLRVDVKEGTLGFVSNGKISDIDNANSLLYNTSTGQTSIVEVEVETNNYINWSNKTLSFNRTHLDVVFSEMESFFGVEIDVTGDISDKCHFTAPLISDVKVQDLFKLLHSSFNFELKQIAKNTFTVSSIKCQ